MINSEDYYKRIKKLNIEHYTGEISYYTHAPIRKVEKSLFLIIKKGSTILDLGCGSGRFSIGAAQAGFNVTGVDITPDAVNAAKKKAEKLDIKNIKLEIGDMTKLSFNEKTFDYVFCPRFSINAVATSFMREKAVEEMLRVVKDGGTVFIESFNKLYLGDGIVFLFKNIFRDILIYFSILYCYFINKKYEGLLPGDIIYRANKTKDASVGYAHLPTIFELFKLIPKGYKFKFYSIPQINGENKYDFFKYFRYSIWIFIKNNKN